MTLQGFSEILEEVGIPVAHYKAHLTEYPYMVFREIGTTYNHASGNAWRELTHVGVDHFTNIEWDETVEKLKLVLLKKKINFTTAIIWYEDDEVIHTSFDLTIARDLEVEK